MLTQDCFFRSGTQIVKVMFIELRFVSVKRPLGRDIKSFFLLTGEMCVLPSFFAQGSLVHFS